MKCLELSLVLRLKFLFLFFFFFSPSLFAATVFLKDRVEVSSSEILLGDLAQLEGSPLEVDILKSISVAKSPTPCRTIYLSKKDVANRIASFLRKNKISFKEIAVVGPEQILVKRKCVVIDGDRIKELIVKYFKKKYPDIVVLTVPSPSIRIASDNIKEVLKLDSLSDRYARFVYEVYDNEGRLLKKYWIPVRIDRKVPVVVASRLIPKGTLITPQMVVVKSLPSLKARGGIKELSSVLGKVARRDFSPGDIIREKDIQPNFMVKRGQPVKVIYDNGGIHIELLGVALEDGALGDIIRVKNVSTGKVLRCQVKGSGLVYFVSD